MEHRSPDPQRVFLSILPAQRTERRIALAVVLASLAISLATAPFAQVKLPRMDAFIPIYESALTFNDLITAVLLFGQFTILRSRAILLLACAYLFTGLMVVAHMLSFPGLFAEGGLLGGGPQTTAWLYFIWHAVFPLLVMIYALQPRVGTEPRQDCAAGCAFSWHRRDRARCRRRRCRADNGGPWPAAGDHGRQRLYTGHQSRRGRRSWLLSLVALGLLWRRKPHSVLDLWLMVVMFAWFCDVALSAVAECRPLRSWLLFRPHLRLCRDQLCPRRPVAGDPGALCAAGAVAGSGARHPAEGEAELEQRMPSGRASSRPRSPNASRPRRPCARRRSWRPSAAWPAASPTTSTTC